MKKVVNSHLIKFDIPSDLNDIFYINKLCLVNDDPLSNQSIDDIQFLPIQKNRVKGYVMENIMAKKKGK